MLILRWELNVERVLLEMIQKGQASDIRLLNVFVGTLKTFEHRRNPFVVPTII